MYVAEGGWGWLGALVVEVGRVVSCRVRYFSVRPGPVFCCLSRVAGGEGIACVCWYTFMHRTFPVEKSAGVEAEDETGETCPRSSIPGDACSLSRRVYGPENAGYLACPPLVRGCAPCHKTQGQQSASHRRQRSRQTRTHFTLPYHIHGAPPALFTLPSWMTNLHQTKNGTRRRGTAKRRCSPGSTACCWRA